MFRGIGSGIGMRLRTKVILWTLAIGLVVMLVSFGHEPSKPDRSSTCPRMGIDPTQMKEGTCYIGKTKTVVVDMGDQLKLESLDARLEGMRVTTALSGPEGTKVAAPKHEFVTFQVAITNRTGSPQSVGENQFGLPGGWGEATDVERGYEPRSLLSRRTPIAPGETVRGTVTFQVPHGQVEILTREGNLDIDNFGVGGGDYEPEALFGQSEMGVMRTYEAH